MDVLEINVLVLAYLGDTIYENYIRRYLIGKKISNVNDLQVKATEFVSARSQASFVKKLLGEKFFTDEEIAVIMRARNNKNKNHPKSCDIVTYKYATGLEALIGYLDLVGNRNRVEQIMEKIVGEKLC